MSVKKPAYLTLYESLREEIISGIRPFGSRLPSRRILARDRGVSAITAEHSIELLCEEGYAESRPRSGCYVIYRETDGFTLPSVRQEHRISAVPPAPDRDTFPFPALARVMRRVLTEYGEEIMVRSPNAGCPILREALCSYLARNRGIRVQPDQIIIGAGAEYLYGLAVELLGSDRIFGIEAPSYQKIEQVYLSPAALPRLLPSAGNTCAGRRNRIGTSWRMTMNQSFPCFASRRRRFLQAPPARMSSI